MSWRRGWGCLSIRGWQQGDIHCSDHVEKASLVNREDDWMGLVWLWLSEEWWPFWCKKMPTEACWYFLPLAYISAPYSVWWSRLPNQPSDHGNSSLMPTPSWSVPEEAQTQFCKIPGMFWRCLCRNLEAATRGKQPLLSRNWCSAERHGSLLK